MDILRGIETLLVTAGDHPVLTTLIYSAIASLATVIRYHMLVGEQMRQFRKVPADPATPAVIFDVNAVIGMILYAICWPCTLTFALASWVFEFVVTRLDDLGSKEVLKLSRPDGDQP